ncbi:hypothetical protein ZIOFF_006109 [Zingiber officinale]|uniref:Transposase-associated domain-containing protein n=1 Tax=Zingiber officinale TaxID=94328 RepID=A0A8J5HX64_ZINOF|nr:hypothetical protein ZIOFF_006109 [Zingiber officinale]
MDKAWMKLPRYSPEYINGVEVFLNYAYTKGNPQGVEILCPCAKCHNAFWRTRAVVLDHLIGYGFEKGYDVWVRHGEGLINPMDLNGDMDDREDIIDDIDGLLESMPQLNIPDSLNKTRGMIRDLGLGIKRLMLALMTACYIRKITRMTPLAMFVELHDGLRMLKEIANLRKIRKLTKFPIKWHEEERSKDGKLRHPADGEAWKDFDKCHPNFAIDSRNIRLGLTSDGFNPFRSMNVSHKTRLNRMTRNSDRCDPCEVGIGHSIGSAKVISLEYKLRSQAQRYILLIMMKFKNSLGKEHENVITNVKKRKKWSKAKSQGQDFVEWFNNRALMDDVPDHLKELSRGPNTIARCFSSYVINGYRFHTKQCDAKCKTQNSGVSVVSVTQSFASTKDENPTTKPIAYYGSIIEIIELDYYGSSKFVLFRCDWYEVEDDKYGLTCVYFNKRCYVDDPFVLASQELYQSEPSDHAVNLAIVDSNYEVELVRDDMPATVIENPLLKSNMVESEDELDFDATLSESMD